MRLNPLPLDQLPPALAEKAEENYALLMQRTAEAFALVVTDLGQSGAENMAVADIRCPQSLVTTAGSVVIEADVKNLGRQERTGVSVVLAVAGRTVAQQRVDLPAGGRVPVAFSYRFDAPGDQVAEVRIGGDRLDVDNHRWIALPVRPAVRVLCVDGRPSAEPFGGAADYLVSALAPYGTGPGQSLVYPEVVPEGRLLEVELNRYDCVFLVNVAQFTAGEAEALDRYLKAGGNLVFFLGDQVLADRYNAQLAAAGSGSRRLLPARLGTVQEPAPQRLDPLGYRHPIVQAFRGHDKAGLLSTRVMKYFRLIVPRRSKARVALALENGDPLVVEEPIHRGRVVLFATSADATWTFMPKWPSYVPIVAETLAFVLAGRIRQQNLTVGEPIGGTFMQPATETSLMVRRPDGRTETIAVRREADEGVWAYTDTLLGGVYAVRRGGGEGDVQLFAVNVDPRESDLTKLSADQLRQEVWPEVPFVHQTTWEDVQQEPVAQIARPSPLSRWLLYAVLMLLLVETFLARRFGYPR